MKFNAFTLILSFVLLCTFIILTGCDEQTQRAERLDPDWFNQPMWQQLRGPSAQNNNTFEPQRNVISNNQLPQIYLKTVSHDFGRIGLGSSNNICAFVFTNVGKGNLVISEPKSTCDCTLVKLEDGKLEYAPGESGRIFAGYTDTEVGEVIKHIYFNTNDPENPKIELAITANVVSPVIYEPSKLELSLLENNGACPDIVVKSLDNKPFSIIGFESNANCITVNFNPNQRATEFVLKPRVDVDLLKNLLEGKFNIKLSHPDCPVVSGTFYAPPRFSISPQRLVLSNVDPTRTIVKTIQVTSNYGEDFALNTTFTNGRIISIRDKQKTKNGYQLIVEINPPAKNGNDMFSADVNLSLPGIETFTVQCNGYYPGVRVPISDNDGECKTCGPVRLDKPSMSLNPR